MRSFKEIWLDNREEELNEQNKLQNEEEFISDRNRIHGVDEYARRQFWRNNS